MSRLNLVLSSRRDKAIQISAMYAIHHMQYVRHLYFVFRAFLGNCIPYLDDMWYVDEQKNGVHAKFWLAYAN